MTDLSVIIVNYASWDHLKRCLLSLEYLHDLPTPAVEILVVDNASPEDRLDEFAILFPQVRMLRNTGNHGFAHGCNLGATQSLGDTLLFLNPDCADPQQCVVALWQLLQTEGPAIVSCRQIDGADRLQKAFGPFPTLLTSFGPGRALARLLWRRRYPRPTDLRQGHHLVDWVSGSVLMLPAESLQRLDGWHDGYWMYSEDVDLCRRARDQALPVLYCAEITLVHYHGGSSRQNQAIRGLTRAETVISRHLYAHRHMASVRRLFVHVFIIIFRYLGKIPAKLWQLLTGRKSSLSITFDELSRYYRGAMRGRSWVSPRSVRYGSDDTAPVVEDQ